MTRFPKIAPPLAISIAGLAIAGWAWDVEVLKRVLPASVAMNPMTAAAFMLAAISLWLQADTEGRTPVRGKRRGMAAALACLTALIGAVRLLDYIAGWNAGIDRLLFAGKLGAPGGLPNRMAPNTSFTFLLLGAALASLDAAGERLRGLSRLFSIFVALEAFLALVGHAYNAPRLYGVSPYIGMAVNTAACFLILASGAMLARPDRGPAAILASPRGGGIMARRLLPAAVAVPVILGWLRLLGQRRGLYGAETGLALLVTATVILLASLIFWQAARLDEADRDRDRGEESLRESQRRLSHALDISQAAVVSIDEGQRVTSYDERAQRIFQYSPEEAVGRPLDILLPVRLAEVHRRHVRDFAAAAETARRMGERRAVSGRRKDGSEFPAEVAISKSRENGAWRLTSVVRDITERKRAEDEIRGSAERLAAANRELESANKELEAFSYSVSHDLRAPLRGIDGFSQILLEDYSARLDDQGRDHLGRIRQACQRMGRLIDDLLSLSRVIRREIKLEQADLSAVARAVMERLKTADPGRQVEFLAPPELPATGDPGLLRAALENLLGNAWKFTGKKRDARIELGVAQKEGEAVYFVKDNGAGFDMAYANKLFGAFQRLHSQEEFSGTGIGLATVQRIVSRHGGRVWAEGAVGEGAAFYFTLGPKGESHGSR